MKKTKEFVVYKITNAINGMCYIGRTVDYRQRMRKHFRTKDNTYLHNSIQKYGKEKFTTEIIFECDSFEDLCQKEIEYIKIFNTMSPNGYNLTCGGDGALGLRHSKETLKKMSDSHKNMSDETRKKMSEAARNISDETRKKMSDTAKNRKQSKETCKKISEANKGKKRSLETRKKMSAWQIGKKYSKETRKKISEAGRIFSKDQILEMRKMLMDEITQCKIAKKFNVTQRTISRIKRNEIYAEIQLP